MGIAGDVSIEIRADSSDLEKGLRSAHDRINVAAKRVEARYKTLFRNIGGAAKRVGRSLLSLKTAVAGAFMGLGIVKVLGEFATFESALVDMGKVTSESFESIRMKIMALPSQLGSATELVRGYYQVISAGVKGAATQMDTLVVASKLAKTAHADQAEVITGLSSVMDAFKVTAGEAADSMQTMEKTGKTTVSNLIPIIGELSSGSATLGISLDDMAAAFAAVTLSSGGTEKANTQFKAVLTSLLAPTADMKTLLDGYGGAQNAIKEIGFGGVIQLISDATDGNAVATKEMMGSVEAYLGIVAMSANDMQTFNSNLDEQKEKAGAVDKAWVEYTKTLNSVWDTFKNTIGKQIIEIGEKLAPAIKKVIIATGQWFDRNKELITVKISEFIDQIYITLGELITGFANAVAGIYKFKTACHEAVSFIAAMGTAMIDLTTVAALIANPVDAAKVAIYGFEAVFPTLSSLRNKFNEVGESQAAAAIETERSREKFEAYGAKIKATADSITQLGSDSIVTTGKVAKLRGEVDRLESKKIVVEVETKFTGSGSKTLPLSKKVDEMWNSQREYADKVGQLGANINTKFTGSGAGAGSQSISSAFNRIEDSWQDTADTIEECVPAADIDIDPALAAIEKIEDRVQSFTNNTMEAIARTMESLGNLNWGSQYAGLAARGMGQQVDQFYGAIAKEKRVGELEKKLVTEYYNRSFATGTDYVPKTGVYKLHQGEIVVPKDKSDQIRSGENTQKSNVFNITFSPTVMSGDKASMRQAALCFRDELKQLDHRWA